ncbi:MAG: hypothetical protein VX949_07805 [Planctomycetota bacterium]|nr:hypothetical protein [Planctomycetota bacterium]
MIQRSEAIPLLLASILISAAALTTIPLDRGLEKDGIALPVSSATGVPADVLLMQQTLGAFRGWAIDALWLRALERRDQGLLHESMELAHWITKLQPYFPRVWNFQAWMLAFEMALDSRDPQQRWTWVREAIDLLRGPGLRANPHSQEIHRQLSYLFWFKIGEFQDEAAPYYQKRLCQRWQTILGHPPGRDASRYFEVLDRVAGSPDQVRELSMGLATDSDLIDRLGQAARDPEMALSSGVASKFPSLEAEGVQAVEDFLRRRLIEDELNMSPDLMARLGEELGPVDWRTAAAHAIYWGAQGALRAGSDDLSTGLNSDNIDEVLTAIDVRIGLQQLVAHGRVLLGDDDRLVTTLPQPGILPAYERALLLLTDGQGIAAELLPRVLEIVSAAVVTSWLQGEDELARQLLQRRDVLARSEPRPQSDDLVDVVKSLVLDTLDADDGDREKRSLLVGIHGRALVAGGGGGTEVEASRGRLLASQLELDLFGSRSAEIPRGAIARALRTPSAAAPLSVKRRIWETLTPEAREMIDITTRSLLLSEGRSSGKDAAVVFPGIDSGDAAGVGDSGGD